ncbi:MAG: nuclease-related domain-containing protein [Chloroflexota bacterium]|nr:NERD domain-containing protein [Chloroflexota bacterium]
MLVITNQAFVDKQISRNRLLFWIGVGCLLASMVALFLGAGVPMLVFLFGYPLLILGVILTKRGAFGNRRHGVGGYQTKSEAVEIEAVLKNVPPRFHLYNWVTIGEELYEHVLVTPNGIMLLLVKGQFGKVKAGHDHFRLKQGAIGWIGSLGEPLMGNPSKDLARQVKTLRTWFEGQGYELPTDGIIIFNNPRSEILGAEEMSFPVCLMHDLKLAVRGWETELNMSIQEQQEVEKLLIKNLPTEQAVKVEQLIQVPEYKRKALMEAEKPEKVEKKDLVATAKERAKTAKAASPLTPGTSAANQRLGLNGKPLPPKVEKPRKARRDVAPLPKINQGAFGETERRSK